jgi:hypothetical protein
LKPDSPSPSSSQELASPALLWSEDEVLRSACLVLFGYFRFVSFFFFHSFNVNSIEQ